MNTIRVRASWLLAGVACASTAWAQTAGQSADGPAPAPSAPGSDLAEVIVTAEKRSERLADVPLSITAATGDELEKLGVRGAADLEKVVPGFTYRLSQNGTPVFQIRGIGFYDEQLAVAPAVTIYTDQVPLPYGRMTEGAALDIERVEVLKGPQGTLFGQNATGGAVNYIAAKPTNTFAAGADASYGRFNEFDAGGFISGPVTDGLNARLAFKSELRGDWQVSNTRHDTIGRRDFQAARLLLDWHTVDALSVEFNLNGWLDRSATQMGQARAYLPVSGAPPETPVTIASANDLINYPYLTHNSNRIADWNAGNDFLRDDRFYQFAARVDYAITEGLHLVSISSYADLKAYSPVDADATPYSVLLVTQTGSVKSLSQELRLEGNAERLEWMLGANYQKDKTRELQRTTIDGSNSQAPTPNGGFIHFDGINLSNNEDIRDIAGFVNLTYKLTDTWSIQGGGRYTSENLDFSGCMADGGGPLGFRIAFPPGIPPGGCLTVQANGQSGLYSTALDQNNVSWRGSVNWKVTPDSLLYANVTKGFKSGSFGTLPAVSYLQFKPVSQESVVAYETGFKTALAAHKVDLSGAAFYYDYADKQIQGYILVPPFGNLPYLVNIPKSRVAGAELDLVMRPVEGLRVTLGGTYLASKVLGTALVGSPFGDTINAGGEAFPATPRWQVQSDIEYDCPLWSNWTGFVGGNYSYRTATTAAFGSKTGPAGTQSYFDIRGYGLLDLRAGVDVAGKYRIQVYGDNVTDTKYWNNVTHIYDTVDRLTGFPLTFGIRLSARF
jgi:outer membrane receptor protein involved in Fe transport